MFNVGDKVIAKGGVLGPSLQGYRNLVGEVVEQKFLRVKVRYDDGKELSFLVTELKFARK